MSVSSNIAKVKSRGKIYFHYAETKRIYVLQDKYIKYVRIMTDYVAKMIVGGGIYFYLCNVPGKEHSLTHTIQF